MRGYFGIGIYHTKTEYNVGTLLRTAQNFGAAFAFTIGRRYTKQPSDTQAFSRHCPLYHFDTFEGFAAGGRPYDCQLIGVEQSNESVSVVEFKHPQRAIYLLGAEDHGLPFSVMAKCQRIIHINTPSCINVAVAGSIIMYDRAMKGELHAESKH